MPILNRNGQVFTSATLYDRMMAALLYILRRFPYDGGKGIISTAYIPTTKLIKNLLLTTLVYIKNLDGLRIHQIVLRNKHIQVL